jgi:wyosine [tRNA(Phe)-imidazoG37] synthetase (radical SAM superfamily)
MTAGPDIPDPRVLRDHRRQWRDCLYVYPVVSRRARGMSIGVNLNPDKRCTFACVYCQIDRRVHRGLTGVDLAILHDEMHLAMEEAVSGRLWHEPRFNTTPGELRRLNDIAFSGDGEPTCLENFDAAVDAAARVREEFGRPDVKLVVITNATHLDREPFRRALPILDANNGEVWAKLDAGTEAFFRRVNRPRVGLTLEKVVSDIAEVAAGRPVVIQSLFFRENGTAPPDAEVDAYCWRLREIVDAGGGIKLVQLHTVARPPAESFVAALADERLEAIAARVRAALEDVPVEVFPGQDVPPQA